MIKKVFSNIFVNQFSFCVHSPTKAVVGFIDWAFRWLKSQRVGR